MRWGNAVFLEAFFSVDAAEVFFELLTACSDGKRRNNVHDEKTHSLSGFGFVFFVQNNGRISAILTCCFAKKMYNYIGNREIPTATGDRRPEMYGALKSFGR